MSSDPPALAHVAYPKSTRHGGGLIFFFPPILRAVAAPSARSGAAVSAAEPAFDARHLVFLRKWNNVRSLSPFSFVSLSQKQKARMKRRRFDGPHNLEPLVFPNLPPPCRCHGCMGCFIYQHTCEWTATVGDMCFSCNGRRVELQEARKQVADLTHSQTSS